VPQPAKSHDHKVTLVVRSTSGRFTEDYNLSNKVEKILGDAVRRFSLATGAGITYLVVRERGNVTMNPAEKLSSYDLVEGDVVVVQTSQPQDG
jgi:hypothetical protein